MAPARHRRRIVTAPTMGPRTWLGKSMMFSRKSTLFTEDWEILSVWLTCPMRTEWSVTSVERQRRGRGASTKGTRKCRPAGHSLENWPNRSTIMAKPSSTT